MVFSYKNKLKIRFLDSKNIDPDFPITRDDQKNNLLLALKKKKIQEWTTLEGEKKTSAGLGF